MKNVMAGVVGLFLVCACDSVGGGSGMSPPPELFKAELGGSCQLNAECESDFCMMVEGRGARQGICSRACGSDADCSGRLPVCGTGADGSHACVYGCPSDFHYGFVCVDGTPVACGTDETLCEECGCPDSLRCQPGVGCVAKSDLDGACRSDNDCKTGNCSSFLGVCRVPVGSACTADNCDLCQTAANGYSFCNRDCKVDAECNGSLCLTYDGDSVGFCYQRCGGFGDASCPGTCRVSGGRIGQLYCDCTSDCEIKQALRPLGAECVNDALCESGACYSQCAPNGNCRGWCSRNCAQSSDCGNGLICANVPCVDAAACGAQCVPACSPQGACKTGYFCRQLEELGASATASVCDIKLPDMAGCSGGGQCQSGLCFMGTCVPPGGDKNANGGNCTNGADCQSNNCVASRCRGTALLGDACSADVDCSAGTCCPSGQNAGKCTSSCL